MRHSRPGSIQSAVRAAVTAVGGLENASADLGVSAATLSYGCTVDEARPGGLGVNYLDRLARMHPEAAAPLARHFATLAGGVFQPVETDANACLRALFTEVCGESSQAFSAFANFLAEPTEANRAALAKEMREAAEVMSRSLTHVESTAPGAVPMTRKSA